MRWTLFDDTTEVSPSLSRSRCTHTWTGNSYDCSEIRWPLHSKYFREQTLAHAPAYDRSSASGDACAKIYNLSQSTTPADTPRMSSDIVWNAFYVQALLVHHHRRNSILDLPHGDHQTERFTAALDARNKEMVGIGQPHWAHACDECEKSVVIDTEQGPMSGMFHCPRVMIDD